MTDILGGGAPEGGVGFAGPEAEILDVTIETFQRDVLEASLEKPVIVDFWATWCGPCRTLTPMLEKVVRAAGGAVRLAKIDIDKNQMLASQLRIQSVPTVYAFIQGQPVDAFQGAIPESEVKAFVDRLVEGAARMGGGGPEASLDDILTAADEALDAGRAAEAADAYAAVADAAAGKDEAAEVRALGGLARCHLALKDVDKARQVFEMIPEAKRDDPALASVAAALTLAGARGGDLAALRARVETAPDDLAARFDYAEALAGAGDMAAGVEELLAIVAAERDWNDGAARQKLITIFDALGAKHPVTLKGRRRLSSILFA